LACDPPFILRRIVLAAAAELIEPTDEDGVGRRLDIEEFEAHTNSGFDDADHGESLHGFAFAFEGDAGAGLHGEGLAGTDETAAEGDVRSDTFGADAGLEVEDFRVGSKRVTDSVAAVAQAYFVRRAISRSVVHEK
jgi:hypothetical protein